MGLYTTPDLGWAESMGPQLRAEFERQLLADLRHYGVEGEDLVFDWSETCGEGHCTTFLDGTLQSLSCVVVLNTNGECVAEGWLEFIHGGDGNPLFVFWEFLTISRQGAMVDVKKEPGIPLHIWEMLPDSSRALCTVSDRHDAAWADDPLVRAWRRDHAP